MWLRLLPALLFVVLPSLAAACAAPEPVRLRVSHATFGELGRHTVHFRCDGDRLIVETRAEIEVRLLVVPVFHRSVRYREVWSGDQLLEFFGETVDRGEERSVVRARLDGGRMVIEGPRGRIEGPPEVIPSHPWSPLSVEREVMFDVVDGTLLQVQHQDLGESQIEIDGEPVRARHFLTTGQIRRELWYAPDGRWLQWRLERQGTVTLTREPS